MEDEPTSHLESSEEEESTLYSRLGCLPTACLQDLKRAYQKAVLTCHPDRSPEDIQAVERFRLIQEAWEVLRDPCLRKDYDKQMAERAGHVDGGGFFISEEVALSDMEPQEDEDDEQPMYTYPCRCGERYQVAGCAVGPEKEVVLECDGCSLKIRVVHQHQQPSP